jgi:hypothetical protein
MMSANTLPVAKSIPWPEGGPDLDVLASLDSPWTVAALFPGDGWEIVYFDTYGEMDWKCMNGSLFADNPTHYVILTQP